MKPRLKPPTTVARSSDGAVNADAVLQVKVWLVGISPMVWRRLLVPASFSLRELHGVIQVAMGWDGIHLYVFRPRAARYGSPELSASSPDVTLAGLRFRKRAQLIYEYDLNIPWRHEVCIEDRLEREARKTYPVCTGGDGACPPKDCGGPESFMDHRDIGCHSKRLKVSTPWSRFFRPLCRRTSRRRSRSTRRRAGAWEMPWNGPGLARTPRVGRLRAGTSVNTRLRAGEHRTLMHQQ